MKKTNLELLSQGTALITPKNGLKNKLNIAEKENRPLIIKLGFDPTAPDLHLGHAVVLRKLKEFQDLGHTIIVIIGDFTACIGDPTGKNKTRPQLTPDEVNQNTKTYIKQLSTILDIDKVIIKLNSEWLDQMNMRDAVELLAKYNLARMMERDDFKNRFKKGISISMHELIYPLLQGYDSFAIKADIEIGGTDQLFNCLVGRHIQEVRGQVSQTVVSMPLLRGLDGHDKMSKSHGNYIGLTDTPVDMYGKVMSIPDTLLEEYIDLATYLTDKNKNALKETLSRKETNPMNIKKLIAYNITSNYHGIKKADLAQSFFEQQFQSKNKQTYKLTILENLTTISNMRVIDLCVLVEPTRSKSMIKRMIKEGGISIDGNKLNDPNYVFPENTTSVNLKIGKRGYYKVQAKK